VKDAAQLEGSPPTRPRAPQPEPGKRAAASPEPEYIQIVDITKTVTEPLNAINDTVDVLGKSCLWVVVGAVVYRRRHQPVE
jgi:hypothetical protein